MLLYSIHLVNWCIIKQLLTCCVCVCLHKPSIHYLYVPGPLVGLVSHLLLNTGQFLLQVPGLMLVQVCEVI